MDWFFFVLFAAPTLWGAVQAVRSPDLVHVVLWLALTLLGTAGLYATLDAGFLAAIQVLLYTGGVITLMLFAVLLARRMGGSIPAGGHVDVARAGAGVAAFAAVVGATLLRQPAVEGAAEAPTPAALGAVVMNDLALPFEALSVLLLAAMVGAIVLSRRKDA